VGGQDPLDAGPGERDALSLLAQHPAQGPGEGFLCFFIKPFIGFVSLQYNTEYSPFPLAVGGVVKKAFVCIVLLYKTWFLFLSNFFHPPQKPDNILLDNKDFSKARLKIAGE
jgi:hypothetical protein